MRVLSRRNLLMMVVALPVGTLLGVWFNREPTTALTREALIAARELWRRTGPDSYELDYRMAGAAYRIVVREGKVAEALVNGVPPTSGDWNLYSVEGLFTTLEQELENVADATGAFADRKDVLMLRVRFHPEFGYIERYLRSGGGIGRGATIENVRLRRIP